MSWLVVFGKIGLIVVLMFVCRIVETTNIMNAKNGLRVWIVANPRALYSICNIHLGISLGCVGALLGMRGTGLVDEGNRLALLAMILLPVVGSLSRGVLTDGSQPTDIGWSNPVWRYGVIVPMGFALGAVVLTVALLRRWGA